MILPLGAPPFFHNLGKLMHMQIQVQEFFHLQQFRMNDRAIKVLLDLQNVQVSVEMFRIYGVLRGMGWGDGLAANCVPDVG